MPYGKRYKKPTKKRSSRITSKATDVSRTIDTLWKKVNYLSKRPKPERKVVDVVGSPSVSSTGTMVLMNGVNRGTGPFERTGDVIRMSYFGMRLRASINSAAGNSFLRVLVITDRRQISDTNPTIADVLGTGYTVSSFLNYNSLGRFKIHYDKTFPFDQQGSSATRKIDINLPLRGMKTKFNGATAADIEEGGIYVIMVSDQPTNLVGTAYEIRMRYYDN